jgi:CubicO group peptidase (beta-lactamase class C family)
MTDKPGFTADHKTNVCANGKSVAAVVLGAALVDKGLLSYQDKVTKHWPEFG